MISLFSCASCIGVIGENESERNLTNQTTKILKQTKKEIGLNSKGKNKLHMQCYENRKLIILLRCLNPPSPKLRRIKSTFAEATVDKIRLR